MKPEREEMQQKTFDAVQSAILAYLGTIPAGRSDTTLDEVMEEFIDAIDFTESLHINVMMSAIGTSISNAREMSKQKEFQKDAPILVKTTKELFARCKTDVIRMMDHRLEQTLVKLDVEDLWNTSLTHNQKLAQELLRESDASKS